MNERLSCSKFKCLMELEGENLRLKQLVVDLNWD